MYNWYESNKELFAEHPLFNNNMAKDIMKDIELTVAKARTYPDSTKAKIEYNIVELPDHPEIKEDSFFGIPAYRDDSRRKGTLNLIYKLM